VEWIFVIFIAILLILQDIFVLLTVFKDKGIIPPQVS